MADEMEVASEQQASLQSKLKKALEYLGKRWVMHPEYEYTPRHSQNGYSTGKYKAMPKDVK